MSPYKKNYRELCFNFRNECLKEELVCDKLPDVKKMAINHVYLIERDKLLSSIQVEDDFFHQFNLNEAYRSLEKEDINNISNLNHHLNPHKKETATNIALQYLVNDSKNKCAKIMYNLINNYDYGEGLYYKDESLFITRALVPFLSSIFPTGGTMIKDGHFTNLIGNNDLKPDVKYSARVGSAIYDFLVFEVKSPSSAIKGDLFKISLELQHMINRMVDNNINKPVVYGVVGQGFDYDIYKMELVAPMMYLMIKIRSFYLPRSIYDFSNVLTTIPSLLQLEKITTDEVHKVNENILDTESSQYGWTRQPLIKFKSPY